MTEGSTSLRVLNLLLVLGVVAGWCLLFPISTFAAYIAFAYGGLDVGGGPSYFAGLGFSVLSILSTWLAVFVVLRLIRRLGLSVRTVSRGGSE